MSSKAIAISLALLTSLSLAADDPRLATFNNRVQEFAKIRANAASKVPGLPNRATPEQIQKHEGALVAAIRAARANAKQGDVFVPEVQPLFLELLKSNLSGNDNKNSRATARQGNPGNDKEPGETAPRIAVNAVYPKSAPLSTVPPLLLLQLPKLPENIEYRFVGQTLVLWDNISNLIIDYMKGAVPAL